MLGRLFLISQKPNFELASFSPEIPHFLRWAENGVYPLKFTVHVIIERKDRR
jgi:hypothetical protein